MAEEGTGSEAAKATTTDNSAISLEELQIILNPMTKEELFVEADGWLMLLQKAAKRVSIAKLEVFNANKKIDRQEKIQETNKKIEEKMIEIEKEHGMDASVDYLEAFLEEKKMSYNQYIEDLAKPKGIAAVFFNKMKKLFA